MIAAPARPLLALAAFAALALAGPTAAAGPAVPWADPIGTSPPLGTAPGAPSVPHAQPIGASRLQPPPAAPRTIRARPVPARQPARCYRVLDAGRIVTRCLPPG